MVKSSPARPCGHAGVDLPRRMAYLFTVRATRRLQARPTSQHIGKKFGGSGLCEACCFRTLACRVSLEADVKSTFTFLVLDQASSKLNQNNRRGCAVAFCFVGDPDSSGSRGRPPGWHAGRHLGTLVLLRECQAVLLPSGVKYIKKVTCVEHFSHIGAGVHIRVACS